jgi:hypothetical protein
MVQLFHVSFVLARIVHLSVPSEILSRRGSFFQTMDHEPSRL